MNGTFTEKVGNVSRQGVRKRMAGAVLAGILAFGAPVAVAASAERRVEASRELDRVKIENLQRWVSAGHETWCREARLVAMDEIRRLVPSFGGNSLDLEALPFDTETASANRATFVWSSPDGRATYRVTVERFGWLLPIAGDAEGIVWVPTHAEIITHR